MAEAAREQALASLKGYVSKSTDFVKWQWLTRIPINRFREREEYSDLVLTCGVG